MLNIFSYFLESKGFLPASILKPVSPSQVNRKHSVTGGTEPNDVQNNLNNTDRNPSLSSIHRPTRPAPSVIPAHHHRAAPPPPPIPVREAEPSLIELAEEVTEDHRYEEIDESDNNITSPTLEHLHHPIVSQNMLVPYHFLNIWVAILTK